MKKSPRARVSISSMVRPVSAPFSGTTTTSMASPRLRSVRSSSRIRSDSRTKRAVSGKRIISAIRSAPIWVGSTTLLAPAWISLRSVETASPRAMISILVFRLRAVSVMKTLAASFGSTVASARAR